MNKQVRSTRPTWPRHDQNHKQMLVRNIHTHIPKSQADIKTPRIHQACRAIPHSHIHTNHSMCQATIAFVIPAHTPAASEEQHTRAKSLIVEQVRCVDKAVQEQAQQWNLQRVQNHKSLWQQGFARDNRSPVAPTLVRPDQKKLRCLRGARGMCQVWLAKSLDENTPWNVRSLRKTLRGDVAEPERSFRC